MESYNLTKKINSGEMKSCFYEETRVEGMTFYQLDNEFGNEDDLVLAWSFINKIREIGKIKK